MENLSSHEGSISDKRTGYLEWQEYFMSIALLAAKRSKDPATQVGACIVNKYNQIVGIGYNGMPKGLDDGTFPWGKSSENELERKYLYVCHAETNAILNKISADVRGCTIYVALFPCNECAKFIIQSGITKVVYMSDKYADMNSTIASKLMFKATGVETQQYIPTRNKIEINFTDD